MTLEEWTEKAAREIEEIAMATVWEIVEEDITVSISPIREGLSVIIYADCVPDKEKAFDLEYAYVYGQVENWTTNGTTDREHYDLIGEIAAELEKQAAKMKAFHAGLSVRD